MRIYEKAAKRRKNIVSNKISLDFRILPIYNGDHLKKETPPQRTKDISGWKWVDVGKEDRTTRDREAVVKKMREGKNKRRELRPGLERLKKESLQEEVRERSRNGEEGALIKGKREPENKEGNLMEEGKTRGRRE